MSKFFIIMSIIIAIGFGMMLGPILYKISFMPLDAAIFAYGVFVLFLSCVILMLKEILF